MKLGYEKLMEENKLTLAELPSDAKIGIKQVKKLFNAIKAKQENQEPVFKSAMDKLRANDKWIVNEILDFLEDKDDNEDKIPFTENQMQKEIDKLTEDDDTDDDDDDNDDEEEEEEDDDSEDYQDEEEQEEEEEDELEPITDIELGSKIDAEISALFATGSAEHSLDSLKASAPNVYNVIFDGYEASQQNGVITDFWQILETSPESLKFKITKL